MNLTAHQDRQLNEYLDGISGQEPDPVKVPIDITETVYDFCQCQGIERDEWEHERELTLLDILKERHIVVTCREDEIKERIENGKFQAYDKYLVWITAHRNNREFGAYLGSVLVDLVKSQTPVADLFRELVSIGKVTA